MTVSPFLFVSAGHKDSVTCAVFSHDSSMVATGDMSGVIKVWKVDAKEEIWSFEVGDLEVTVIPPSAGNCVFTLVSCKRSQSLL